MSSIDETRGVSAKLHSPAGSPCSSEALLCLWHRHCPSLNLLVAWLPQQEYSRDLCCSVQWFSCIFCQLLHGRVCFKGGEWRGCGGCIGVRVHKASQEVRAGTFHGALWVSSPPVLARLRAAWTSFEFRKSAGSIYMHVLWFEPIVKWTVCLQKYSSHQSDPCCKFSCLPSPAGCCCSNL